MTEFKVIDRNANGRCPVNNWGFPTFRAAFISCWEIPQELTADQLLDTAADYEDWLTSPESRSLDPNSRTAMERRMNDIFSQALNL